MTVLSWYNIVLWLIAVGGALLLSPLAHFGCGPGHT